MRSIPNLAMATDQRFQPSAMAPSALALVRLLQLASPALPVGAYTYSEGLETLVQTEVLTDAAGLEQWLLQELRQGAMGLEATVLAQVLQALQGGDLEAVQRWNHWLSALRETQELREQSWQMGRSLVRLLPAVDPLLAQPLSQCGTPCNFAIAYGVAAHHWQIQPSAAVMGYLQSWAANLVTSSVKLIPLGQTTGQQVLWRLAPVLEQVTMEALARPADALWACGWGVAIASMQHETLYTRLYRS